ncbi:hypothetical protein DM860_003014 [Cuscuta australis]|uniref:Uncharacterized protein n=1 Tax=Cuscuta australis TaxID=267555 RepID=A0A328D4Y6_9ASTE|nr:hypothetical protein DM860_003014 [Cuscuta australis]
MAVVPRSASTAPTTITAETPVIQIHSKTHFPIKLRSTLIGYNLLGYIDGSRLAPPLHTDTTRPVVNPCHFIWFCQDQVIISALLGSCIDTIQPLISMVDTAAIAWSNLTSSFASASHGRVVSLKSKLSKNPRGTRSVQEYLNGMQSIANDLALAQHPVPEMDLIVHVLNQMGEEYDIIVPAARVRESKLQFTELGDILKEHETKLKTAEESKQIIVATAHATQRSNPGSCARQ